MASPSSTRSVGLSIRWLTPADYEQPCTWRFDGTRMVQIGRSDDNDVTLPQPEVSRVHLVLFLNGDHWECSSVGRYGTYLAGRPIKHTVVTDGMILQCTESGPRLQFHVSHLAPADPSDRPVTALVDELAGGGQSAATGLWEEYFERVVALARARLRPGMRRAADE